MRPKLFFFFPLIVVAMSFIVMFIWNTVIVEILSVPRIHFFQATGILILSRILFGGMPFRSGRRFYGPPFRSRWMNMTPEERQKFKEQWRKRWGQ